MPTIKTVPQYLVLTAVGENKTGLISELTGLVYQCGCNVVDSKMAIFASELSMIMLLEGNQHDLVQLENQMPQLAGELNLLTMMKRTSHANSKLTLDNLDHHYLISIEGPDRPGTIKELTSLMARKNIDISGLRSKIIKRSSGDLQTAQLEISLTKASQLDDISNELTLICKKFEMSFTITSISVNN